MVVDKSPFVCGLLTIHTGSIFMAAISVLVVQPLHMRVKATG